MVKSAFAPLCLALLLAVFPGRSGAAQDQNPYKHLVEIGGGRRLNMVCEGAGSPTVVFLQGLGGNITDWRKVRGPVAAFARTCFYDRAGFGYSDLSNKPSTADNVAKDLHALLRAAKIKGPVVLAGISLGGLFATYYADKFGTDVAGLVLIDPSFSGQFDDPVGAEDARIMEDDAKEFAASMRRCGTLAGERKLSKEDRHDCFFPPRDLTPEEMEYVMHQLIGPSYYANLGSEAENLSRKREGERFVDGVDGAQERRIARHFGDLPLVVLTAGLFAKGMTISDAGKSATQAVWESGHDRLAQRSSRGESIHLPDTGHRIDLEKPEHVVEAIRKVISQARPR
jgi:pimeloyl-ACP methyl ester carboxylesterase